MSCAAQVSQSNPTQEDRRVINEMVRRHYILDPQEWDNIARQGMLPLHVPPPPPMPSPSSAADESSEEEGRGSTTPQKWYEKPFDCPSRKKEPWIRATDGLTRTIECLTSKTKGKVWTTLPDFAIQRILHTYDQEQIGAEVQPIRLDTNQGTMFYKYRVEGGPWLTQWNLSRPGNPPRDVLVRFTEEPHRAWREW